MEVSVQELYALLGQKEVENHLLRRQISLLQKEIEGGDRAEDSDGV